MARQAVYTVGGTVQAGGGIYIKRKADDELLALCRRGEFAYILSSRQIGKSSLVVRTAEQLEQEDVHCAIVDLSAIGVNVSSDEWYLGILNEIVESLALKHDIFAWWEDHKQIGPTHRLVNFFRDMLLTEFSGRVVIFFDEIDSTLSIPFSDDFYAALRFLYNARATNSEMERLSIVLIGVATPSDLIADSRRTPFNIGRQVELTDFTLDEAKPLSAGLGINGELVLEWVFEWTRGHPYLTQLMCASLAKSGESLTKDAVHNTVVSLFEGEQGRRDNNLQFVRDMLTKRAPDVRRVLATYKNIRLGRSVTDDEQSIEKSHLKISGVVRRNNGLLMLRNPIYENAFDLKWLQDNQPSQISNRAMVFSSTMFVLVLIVLGLTGQFNRFIYRPLPMKWVVIPAGEFFMGSDISPDEQPIHVVELDNFEIGAYEVTNEQYNQCVKAGVCNPPFNDQYVDLEFLQYPVTDVTWFNASQFCEWTGARLPTEAEWEKAARGLDGRMYPWGNNLDNTLANFNLNVGETTPVGFYKRGQSPFGIYNMAGNVSEWVADWYSPDFYGNLFLSPTPGPSDPVGPENGTTRVFRGGSWNDDGAFIRSSARHATDPLSTFPSIGFRCARSQ
jgi:formylglycine-generating enzyme required for sulfatase activity